MPEASFQILIDNTGERFGCAAGLDVLRGMECLGRRGIPVGCRGGGCGVCKVRVLDGDYRTAKMSRACVSEQEQAQGYALACRLYADGDLRLQVVGKMARALGAPRPGFDFAGALAAASGRAEPERR
ncbi:MAG: 2Fe-2S iron-sulfur cluster binding domain-containing protein [Nevskia sp.]|nr:2Fe-2S iron-sulfur cluster binding domain-containing protein [Nevskia sp.]